MVHIGNSWDEKLKDEFTKDYYLQLREFLKQEYATRVIYPDMHDIFNALKATAYEDVKVVILGQDPYHEPGQAHGMCFSVKPGVPVPPSLQNMYKEIAAEYPGWPVPQDGYLQKWAEQGVLLLNAVLTVREHAANSHRGKGWEILTDRVIELLNEREDPVIFLLWGRNAREKASLITAPQHAVLQAAHPSPLSAHNGFFGCGHFRRANDLLRQYGKKPVRW
ncbi:MAG: uracil-DNA glycosylase [Firmicutes bacterium]|nr:uracil-DNA glycosylase [Bacillota bacterium]